MTTRKTQIQINIAAFLLLFTVSLYRQISLRLLPDDPFRTYILYACYLILIGCWIVSIMTRITQKNIRFFLTLEAAIILIALTIRFLQDTFWYENIRLMRISGLCIGATVLPAITCGTFAVLGIGSFDGFRIPKKWFLLLVPVIGMVCLHVTDELHHFMCYIIPDEPQPNIVFHPNWGTFLLVAFCFAMAILRTILLFQRSRTIISNRYYLLLILAFEPILALIGLFGYFMTATQLIPALEGVEVIEMYAKIYFFEVLNWEFFIYIGLVPVNTQHSEIFELATVGMQIITNDGNRISSEASTEVSAELLEELKHDGHVSMEPGKELHLHSFEGGLFLWEKDVTFLQNTINELNQSAEVLAQEGILLDEEIKTRNKDASLLAKNQIYDDLTTEVEGQLRLMKEIIKEQRPDVATDGLLRKLYFLGTYIKRRCNLRLIQKETNVVHDDDLQLSLREMTAAMDLIGVSAELCWQSGGNFSADFSIFAFDVLEHLLEYEQFVIDRIVICVDQSRICYMVHGETVHSTEAFIRLIDAKGYSISGNDKPHGYEIILTEDGE